MANSTPQTVQNFLFTQQRVLITTHRNPDGDAIGSSLGLMHSLRHAGILATVLLPNECPPNLRWLPGASTMVVWNQQDGHKKLIDDVDAIAVLDLNNLSRLGDLGEAIVASGKPLVNIDHHADPHDFAQHQWIDTDAPAVCSMLLDVIAGDHLTAEAATCIYTGLMTDTGGFRFPRTTEKIFSQAALLVGKGADPVATYEHVFNSDSFERLRLLAKGLQTVQQHYDGRLCTLVVSQQMFQETQTTLHDTEGFVHHCLGVGSVQAAVLFVELPDEIKCSFRSKGNLSIRHLAASFGGGGHDNASGARIQGSLDDVVQRVVAAAEQLFV